MINGLLIINHYMKSAKFDDLYNMFMKSALDNNINLSVKTNREISVIIEKANDLNKFFENKIDFILFWDKDILLARQLENKGYKVYNSSEAIRICDDKALTYIELDKYNIPMPKTLISPFTYDDRYNEYNNGYAKDVIDTLELPLIAKARYGSFGAQVHKIDTLEELKDIIEQYPAGALIFQEYIKTSHGRDVRIQVVGDKVVTSMYRYSDTDFRANITNGGKMKEHTPSKEECMLALNTAKALELDFAGIDLLYGEDNKMLVCEVNSNAHFRNLYDLTNINVADEILKYILYCI